LSFIKASLDSLHPYGYSGGGITGICPNIEPLIQMDYDRNTVVVESPLRLPSPQSALAGAYVQGVEVETPDDYTVVMTKTPNALLLTRLRLGLFSRRNTAMI
jgi:hypothetical protein